MERCYASQLFGTMTGTSFDLSPAYRSHCGVCMDNQVVRSFFLFIDFTCQHVVRFMKQAIHPLLHEHACTQSQYKINLQGVTQN